jgi:hypothetical protein
MTFGEIPYATEQGILVPKQGMFWKRTGNLVETSRESPILIGDTRQRYPDEVFGSHSLGGGIRVE